MMKRYRAMMEQITLDEAAKSRILEQLCNDEQTTRRFPLRPILAAACLCLILIGGATAKTLSDVWLEKQQSTTEHSSYRVQTGFRKWTMDSLSAQLRSALETGTLQRCFDTKAALENYLGIALIRSDQLEAAGIVEDLESSIEYGWDLRPELFASPNARYVLTGTTVDGTEMGGAPEVLKVTAHRVMKNTEVFLDARIVTEAADTERLKEGLLGENFHPLIHVHSEYLRDENGAIVRDELGRPTVTEVQYYTAEKKFQSSEYKMANGITATIVTATDVALDGSTGLREYAGYFIHDGILYSVRPYAIYDPSQSFPMRDSDMLSVLKAVLDSFA